MATFKVRLMVILIASTINLGLWVMRVSDGSYGYSERHIKVSVGSTHHNPDDMFIKSHREALELLGTELNDHFDEDVETTMKTRRAHLRAVCSLLETNSIPTELAERQLTYYENVNTLYCPVGKVASKFLGRLLHVLNFDDYKSPFEFKGAPLQYLSDVTQGMEQTQRKIYIEKVMNDSVSFIFARNPYKRIFSSYLDKFFSPNSMYWNYAQRRIRKKAIGCGKDLRFSELVQFLISTNPDTYDAHFKPVSTTCDVCNVQYEIIGKVETFKTDLYYFMNLTKNSTKVTFKDFAQENSIHYIIFNSKRTHGMLSDLLTCDTHHNIYLRLWRQLQISGMIEKDNNYPLSPEESKALTLTSLTNLLLDGYHRSTPGAKSNNQNAFLQAYSEVPLEDLEKLRLKYLKDFMLFDYNSRPSDLFTREKSMTNIGEGFDFFDLVEEA